MWNKQTNRNFIERLFRALFFQKSPNISLNSLFHNSVCLYSCVHLMAWIPWCLVMTRWYLGGVWFWRVPAGISWRIQPVPSDLVSQAWSHLFLLTLPQLAKSPPFLPLWARYLEQRLASRDHANKVLKSVDSTGWSEIVQLIQDEVEAKYDRRNFFEQETVLKLA